MSKRIFIVLAFVSLFSCRKELDINIPDRERQIVMNSVLHPDSVVKVNVFRSNHVQDRTMELLYLNNAEVWVYENDAISEKLNLVADGLYIGEELYVKQGIEYRIEVSVPNLGTANAKATTIEAVPIISFDSIGIFSYDDESFSEKEIDTSSDFYYNKYQLKFKDNPEKENFYRVTVYEPYFEAYDTVVYFDDGKDSVMYTLAPGTIDFDSEDPAVEIWRYHDGYLYFSDVLFNGKEYNFELLISPPYIVDKQTVGVKLEHVSEEFFRYMKTYDFHSETKGAEVFFQAVQVYDNVQNGYGILGTTTVSNDSTLIYGRPFSDYYYW